MSMSEALKQAYARSDSSTRHLIAVDLQHSTFDQAGHLRLVNHDDQIEVPTGGDLYLPHAMEAREPAGGSEPDEKVKLRIDGTSGAFQFQINRAIETGVPVYVDFKPFAFNMTAKTVIGVVGTYEFILMSAEYNMTTTMLSLGHVSPTNITFPGIKYTPESHPNLYQ